jgi:hypothetical protein
MRVSAGLFAFVAYYSFLRWIDVFTRNNSSFASAKRTPTFLRQAGFTSTFLLLASTLLTAQSVTVSPTSLSFGNQAVSTTSSAKTVTLKNGQSVAITISSIATSGDFAQTNTCGASLAAGAKCTISVTFTPTVTGSRSGTLTITDSGSNSPQTASLAGTGIAQATVSPATLSFGNQAIDTPSPAKTATLTNNLPTALAVSSITASGNYTQTNTCATSVAAGGTCTISVTFTPTATGSSTGTLTITDAASNSPQSVSLTGSGVVQASASPASLSFGNQVVGFASAVKTVTLTNNLETALSISSIAVSGDYSQTNTCGTLLASETTCTVSVTFTPTTTGSRTGTLTISDGANNSPQTVSLTGNGVVPVTVSPATLAFGNEAVTTTSAAKTVTVTNKQPTAVSITSVTTPAAYAQTNTCGTLLAAEGTCTVSVTFNPTATGSQPGTLTITDNASNSPQTVNLTGTGTALPTITKLSVTSGLVGTSVTITGTGFAGSQGASTVTFNGAPATATSWSSKSIVATVPNSATTGNVVVTVNNGPSNGVLFTVVPNITSLSSTSGIAGTAVTIGGSGFGTLQGTSSVTFNAATGSPTSWSSTSITVPVPNAATGGAGPVIVTVDSVTSNSSPFTVVPNILSLSATSGAIGAPITITGTGFGSTQANSMVAFNGINATASSWSQGAITATVPSGATTGNVVVSVGGIPSSGVSFAVQNGSFIATSGQMVSPEYGQTATQLANGQILLAGGVSNSGVLSGAQLYSLSAQTFTAASPMNVARWLHTATLLNDGTVLITGGSSLSNETTLNSAEIYNSTTGTFTLLPNTLNTARVGHTATLLSSGQVLIVGGYDPNTGIISDSELYDPTAQVFIDLGNTNTPRFHHTATLLQTGQVLIAGGETDPVPDGSYNSAEIFSPASWTFTSLSAPMVSAREGHAATLLNDGTVLITGGDLPPNGSLNSAEIFNPSSNTFSAISATMTSPRIFHDSVLLNGGQVLLSGGENDSNGSNATLNTAEIYNPTARTFTATPGNMVSLREHQTATLLNDGTVLEAGGTDGTNILNTAEIYTISQLTGLTSISISPTTPSVPLGSQQLLTATGTFSGGSTQVLSSVLWSSSSTAVSTVSGDASDSGYVTTIAQGNATITATAAGITGSTIVTVPAPALVSITLSPQTPAMPLGTAQQFDAVGTYSDGSTQDLTSTATWTSSSTSATVNSTGFVTAVALGTSTIQASSGSQSSSTTVTVGSPGLVSLAVTPATAVLAAGQSEQFQAIGTYTDNSTQNLTSSASWFSVPQTSASVNSSGLVTATAPGNVNITAVYGTFSGVSILTVGSAPLVSISVSPSSASIPVGANQQFVAVGNYSNGSTQDITATATWSSSSGTASSVTSTGLATALAGGTTTISASSGSVTGSATLTISTGTLSLNTSRYQHNATLLDNGSVLFAGGVNCLSAGSCTYLSSAELYNPSSGTITNTGSMATARSAPAVLLGNGKVLVAGGYSCDSNGNCASLSSAEIYDPVAGTFSGAGNMTAARDSQTMTLLNNGQVLIVGGETCSSSSLCTTLNSAELYNPVAATFTATGSLNNARFNASAAALASGKVLIAGGFDGTNFPATAELFSPSNGTFTTTGSLNTPRENATATLLNNGQVMIAGGSTCSSPGCPTAITEMFYSSYFYYPTYPSGNMTVPRSNETATILTNGQILFAGGYDSCSTSCNSDATAELFDPVAFTFTSTQGLSTGRSGQTATLLTDGSVLIAGGINNGTTLSSTDSYEPVSLALPQLASITLTPSSETPVAQGATLSLTATGNSSYGSLYGSSAPSLQSVIWTSSSPSVATVSNAVGSSGIVNALTSGTATITASNSTITTSMQVTVTAPLVSITISPLNPTISVGSGQPLQLTATGTFADNSTENLTSNVTWASSNTSVAVLSVVTGNPPIVVPVSSGNANVTATFSGISGSTTVTVNAPLPPVPPNITGVSPASGAAGTPVTVTGSGFGATQGSGNIWLGTTLGSVVSWSDGQIVAVVSTGSNSGVAQVQQINGASNSVPFAVNTATITNVSPNNGLPGTQVTITGSGFGATQGNGNVWLGTLPAIVNSWSDGQVVATVSTGAMSGNAVILQNGVMSNAAPFTINLPQITGISPNSGNAGTAVTVTGSGFGATQGSGNVWIGSTYGTVIGWSDTQIVASVAANALSGIVKVQQNGVWSNAVTFTVSTSLGGGGGTSVTLVPNLMNLSVGGTQQMEALNSGGQSVTGLTWSSSNTAVATLSTDDPPIVTAVGPGTATITAGNASADVTVWSGSTLPIGTVIWSNPGDGSGVSSIVPAVPSSTGVADVFATNADGSVQAITANGQTAWTTPNVSGSLIPDFQGGTAVFTGTTISRLDGMTGIPSTWTYTSQSGNNLTTPVIHTRGTIFTIDGSTLVGINPTTGQTFTIQMENSISSGSAGCTNFCTSPLPPPAENYSNSSPPSIGSLLIAGDGYAYVPYSYTISSGSSANSGCGCGCISSGSSTQFLNLLRVGPTGDSAEISLGEFSSASSGCDCNYQGCGGGGYSASATLPTLLTNADQGVLASYSVNYSNSSTPSYYLAATSGASLASNSQVAMVPEQSYPVQAVLQRADGSFVGTVSSTVGNFMVGFTGAGSTLFTVPNDTPQIATSNGGVIGASGTTYDQNGNVDGQIGTPLTQSWSGNSYKLGSVDQVAAMPIQPAGSFWPFQSANVSANSTAGLKETLYVRSFAPWLWFGIEPYPFPCAYNCFRGDNRSFTTSLSATSRVIGTISFLLPGMTNFDANAYSNPSYDVYGRTATGHPTYQAWTLNGTLHLGFSGSNPLVPGSPDIDTNVNFTAVLNSGQVCYSGSLYGDEFPDAEVFALNSTNQATMLLTFTTPGGPNSGPVIYLPGDGTSNMGTFSNVCGPK